MGRHSDGGVGILAGLVILLALVFGLMHWPGVTLLCLGCFGLGGYVARSIPPRS